MSPPSPAAQIAVVLPTYSPHPGRLGRTLAGLRGQTLPADQWDLIIVDNNSPAPVAPDLGWHPRGRIVREPRPGLTRARLAGVAATRAAVAVFVDDDNVLDPGYLAAAAALFARLPRLGAAGGKVVPEWEAPPEPWVAEFADRLALRDLGDQPQVADPREPGYPACAPVGAGMAVRRAAWEAYATAPAGGPNAVSDRVGTSATSGGDNDIVLSVLRAGWDVGYFPDLVLTHLIPVGRTTPDYLGRLNHGIYRSWVGVLDRHGLRPWPRISRWSVPLRKWRAYLHHRAWVGPGEYVRWRGACGQFEGQAALG